MNRFLMGMIAAGTMLAGVGMADAGVLSVTASPTTFSAEGQPITMTYVIGGEPTETMFSGLWSNGHGPIDCNFPAPWGPDIVRLTPFETVECTAIHITDDLDMARGAVIESGDIIKDHVDIQDFGPVTVATLMATPPATVGCHMPEGQSSRFVFRYRGTGRLPC